MALTQEQDKQRQVKEERRLKSLGLFHWPRGGRTARFKAMARESAEERTRRVVTEVVEQDAANREAQVRA